MKRTVTRSDGSVEVTEGTAEEFAELEKKLEEQGTPPKKGSKKRVLLNEERVRAVVAEEFRKVPQNHYHFGGCQHCNPPVYIPSIWSPVLPAPIWITPQDQITYPQITYPQITWSVGPADDGIVANPPNATGFTVGS